MHFRLSIALLVALLSLGGECWSQLDLPRNPKPHVARPKGLQLPSAPRKRSLLEESFGEDQPARADAEGDELVEEEFQRPNGVLDLPRLSARFRHLTESSEVLAASAAQLLFDKLIRVALSDERRREYFTQLCALGEPAFEVARLQLQMRTPKRALLGGRILLEAGGTEERALVGEYLRGPVKPQVGIPLLRELALRDPLLANPTYLMDQLQHPLGNMREAAAELVLERLDDSWLPRLAASAASGSSSLRLHALKLAAHLSSSGARRLMLSSLGDERSLISTLAVESLAGWEAPDTTELLRQLSLEAAAWDRQAAYALVALVQREINLGQALLHAADVPRLREGLAHRSPLVASAAAAALAGIGFRGDASLDTPWLSMLVPDTLVRLCTGYVFHRDLRGVQGIGLQRLGLISGQPLGSNGFAWQAWWAEHGAGFRPRRSVLTPLANDELNLSVSLATGSGAERRAWTLVGPGIAAPTKDSAEPIFYMSHAQALELMAMIQGQGLFGASRSPGRYGQNSSGVRGLSVGIGAGEKRFEVRGDVGPDWFEAVASAALELQERLHWQLWYDPEQYASNFAIYEAESPWWEQVEPAQRQLRLKLRMLQVLAGRELAQRDEGLAELVRQSGRHAHLDASDFPALLGLLADEVDYGTRFVPDAHSRARDLTSLALQAARTPQGGLQPALAQRLFKLLAQRFGSAARLDLELLLERAGGELLLSSAQSLDALAREVSARPLGSLIAEAGRLIAEKPGIKGVQTPSNLELLAELLRAEEEQVVKAAIQAVGEFQLQNYKPQILRRARPHQDNSKAIRIVALRALGRLGGAGVREMCVLALGEDRLLLSLAAVEGLAAMGDVENLTLLVSLFGRGPETGYFEAAGAGLRQLGSAAAEDLLPLAVSGEGPIRRQATLLLAWAGVPQAASELLMQLTENPADAYLAEELAILSAQDLRSAENPVAAWWAWWDSVVHDDAQAWLLGAMAQAGFDAPREAKRVGEREEASVGLEDLLGWAAVKDPILRERVRRELSWLVGQPIESIPTEAGALEVWRKGLRELGN
jgi:hypothetical protein